MAHEISRESFFDASGKPAWHTLDVMNKLGLIREDRDYFAPEVFGYLGKPDYSMSPMFALDPDGNQIEIGDYTIFRHPVDDDPQYRAIGKASEHYELVAAKHAVDLWQQHIELPVATMMMLRNDGVMVITAELPQYDVKGEQVNSYLVFTNGMDGRTATRSDVSDVRVVCANTLRRAQRSSQQNFVVHHTSGSIERLTGWMATVVERATFQRDVNREVYDILAETPFDSEQVRWIAGTVYRDPAKPRKDFAYKEGYAHALDVYEKGMERVEMKRDNLLKLFTQNTAIGFQDNPLSGTAWHALNSVTQDLTHGVTSSFNARAESLVIGDRASTIEAVTDTIIQIAGRENPELLKVVNQEFEPVLV